MTMLETRLVTKLVLVTRLVEKLVSIKHDHQIRDRKITKRLFNVKNLGFDQTN